ncbi:MAG: His/Gly/Thr/Pro-type tRNA ligase C-terminal domain-containing protein, partial [Thermoplasmatota archaeon]
RSGRIVQALKELDISKIKRSKERGEPLMVELPGEDAREVPAEAVTLVEIEEKTYHEKYTPHVVEPSFGIDRLMVAVLEHAYTEMENSPMKEMVEEDSGPYRVLRLDPRLSPIKCGVFPLMNKDGLPEIARKIVQDLKRFGVTTYYDHSGSIGRRYARMDEIGTPFSITVDYESKEDDTVTIRFRDTAEQIRVPVHDVPARVLRLIKVS